MSDNHNEELTDIVQRLYDNTIGPIYANADENTGKFVDVKPRHYLYAAYIPDGDKKRYLSDGHGRPNLSTDETQLREYLRENLTPEVFATVVIHSVEVTQKEKRKRHKKKGKEL